MMNKSSLRHPIPKPHPATAGSVLRPRAYATLALVLAICFLPEKPASAAASAIADIPVAKFTDVTREAGITFTHVNGAYGDKLLPETMGGGVAFFDFDNDGYQDLLFINSCYWPGHVPERTTPPTMALYHNDGHGHFTDVTKGSGLEISAYGMGAEETVGALRLFTKSQMNAMTASRRPPTVTSPWPDTARAAARPSPGSSPATTTLVGAPLAQIVLAAA